MKPKCEISLPSQGSEHRCSQEFGLRAAQNRNVQSHGHIMLQLMYCTYFFIRSARNNSKNINKERLLIGVSVGMDL